MILTRNAQAFYTDPGRAVACRSLGQTNGRSLPFVTSRDQFPPLAELVLLRLVKKNKLQGTFVNHDYSSLALT
jgi:hypothetical protein